MLMIFIVCHFKISLLLAYIGMWVGRKIIKKKVLKLNLPIEAVDTVYSYR